MIFHRGIYNFKQSGHDGNSTISSIEFYIFLLYFTHTKRDSIFYPIRKYTCLYVYALNPSFICIDAFCMKSIAETLPDSRVGAASPVKVPGLCTASAFETLRLPASRFAPTFVRPLEIASVGQSEQHRANLRYG